MDLGYKSIIQPCMSRHVRPPRIVTLALGSVKLNICCHNKLKKLTMDLAKW